MVKTNRCSNSTSARGHRMLEGNLHLVNHPGKTQKHFPKTLPKTTEQRESCLQKIEKHRTGYKLMPPLEEQGVCSWAIDIHTCLLRQ